MKTRYPYIISNHRILLKTTAGIFTDDFPAQNLSELISLTTLRLNEKPVWSQFFGPNLPIISCLIRVNDNIFIDISCQK